MYSSLSLSVSITGRALRTTVAVKLSFSTRSRPDRRARARALCIGKLTPDFIDRLQEIISMRAISKRILTHDGNRNGWRRQFSALRASIGAVEMRQWHSSFKSGR
jgi:hypothetical protein